MVANSKGNPLCNGAVGETNDRERFFSENFQKSRGKNYNNSLIWTCLSDVYFVRYNDFNVNVLISITRDPGKSEVVRNVCGIYVASITQDRRTYVRNICHMGQMTYMFEKYFWHMCPKNIFCTYVPDTFLHICLENFFAHMFSALFRTYVWCTFWHQTWFLPRFRTRASIFGFDESKKTRLNKHLNWFQSCVLSVLLVKIDN